MSAPLPRLTFSAMLAGHPTVARAESLVTIRGALLAGGEWDLNDVSFSQLHIVDCSLEAKIHFKCPDTFTEMRITNLSRSFEWVSSARIASNPDVAIKCQAVFQQLTIEGQCKLEFIIDVRQINSCNISGELHTIGFLTSNFAGPLKLENLNARDIRFGVCVFHAALELLGIRAHWIVFHMCTFNGASSLLGLKSSEHGRLLLTLDGCKVVNGYINIIEVEAEAVVLAGLSLGRGTELFTHDVRATQFFDWSNISIDETAKIRLEKTPLVGSYFAGTRLDRVAIGLNCWDATIHGTQLRVHKLLKVFDPQELPLRARQFGYWPTSIPTSEGIERTLENYSQLVKYYEDRREFGLAELFHVGEMDMVRWRRTSSRNRLAAWFERNVSAIGLYRLCSMYGSSYLRALTVLVALSIVFALSLMWAGLQCGHVPRDCLNISYQLLPTSFASASAEAWVKDFSRSFIYVLELATLQKDTLFLPANPTGHFLRAIIPIAFAAQAALLVFALRRRFRRASSI